MLSEEQALELALSYIRKQNSSSKMGLAIDVDGIRQKGDALIVEWNSEEYLESRDFRSALVGAMPVRVDLRDGTCRFLSVSELFNP